MARRASEPLVKNTVHSPRNTVCGCLAGKGERKERGDRHIKKIRNIILTLLVIGVVIYVSFYVLLRTPAVQHRIGDVATEELSRLIGSPVSIAGIDISAIDRVILNDVSVRDREGRVLADVNRLSVTMDLLPLFNGKVRINSVQLFGFDIALSRDTVGGGLNIQYIIDRFAKKDGGQDSPIDLRINYLMLRQGRFTYDVLSEDSTPGLFNASHVALGDISANISLKTLTADSINASVKRLAFVERSGLALRRTAFRLRANDDRLLLDDFVIDVGRSGFKVDSVWVADANGRLLARGRGDLSFGMSISGTRVRLSDLAYFDERFARFDRDLSVDVELRGDGGGVELRRCRMDIGDEFNLDLVALADTAGLYARLEDFHVSRPLLELLRPSDAKLRMPGFVDAAGEVYGKYSDLALALDVSSPVGGLSLASSLGVDKRALTVKSAKLSTDGIAVDSIMPQSRLSSLAFGTDVRMRVPFASPAALSLDGAVDVGSLVYDGYAYNGIKIACTAGKGVYAAQLALHDSNADVEARAEVSAAGGVNGAMVDVAASGVDLYALGFTADKRYVGGKMAFHLSGAVRGTSPDDMAGGVDVNDFALVLPDEAFACPSFSVDLENVAGGGKSLYVNSDFLDAYVRGDYSYAGLFPSMVRMTGHYLPIVVHEDAGRKQRHEVRHNNLRFGFEVKDGGFIARLFDLPVSVGDGKVVANGCYDDATGLVRLDCAVPQVAFGGKSFDSSSLSVGTAGLGGVSVDFRSNLLMKNDNVYALALHSSLAGNKIMTDLFWGNNQAETYSGNITAETLLSRHGDGLRTEVRLGKGNFIMKDSLWNIHPSKIVVDSGKVDISRFKIEHKDQYLSVDGVVSHDNGDSIFVDLSKIDMSYIFELANIRRVVDFSGDVTGQVYANGVLSTLRLNADLYVGNFSFNGSRLGDMEIKGGWDNDIKGIVIDADMTDRDLSTTTVDGVIHPIKPGSIDLAINTSHVDLGFLRKYMASIASDISGRASGEIRIHGPFKGGINLTGRALAEDFKFKIDLLNTTLHVTDSVEFRPNLIFMDNILVRDAAGNTARATIRLPHIHLKNLRYDVDAMLDNMLVMDRAESVDLPFYGKIFASGEVSIHGGKGSTNVNADVRTGANSTFSYLINSTSSATSNQFVTFVDKTRRRRSELLKGTADEADDFLSQQHDIGSDVRLNLNVEATPGIYLKMIMDRSAGDYIGGTGSGNIRIDFYNKGDVKMYGNYTIDKGIYKFSIQEIIRKDFIINAGSTISFNGNPLNAELGINAAYTVNSVPLSDLGNDVVNQIGQSNVKVNCTMNLTGALTHPEIKLGLDFPNEGEEVQRTVLNAISTDEQMNMQILYLLSIGRFYVSDYNADNTNQSSSALSSVVSSTISGQLNNMFSNLIDNNNWNIGTNLSTGTDGWTDVEFEGMLSGQLLNNRLLINGNFGYRDNALSQSNFIGDFEVEYLLDRLGIFRLKAYNRTNDRYYTKTTLTTQGLGLVFKRDFDNIRDLFDFSIRKRKDADKTGKR